MKKFLLVLSVLFVGVFLVACNNDEDPSQGYLDAAATSLNAVIADPANITSDISVPTKLANGVTASWASSETGVATVGTADASGIVKITINRPEAGEDDAEVTLTATLSVVSPETEEAVNQTFSIKITVIALPEADLVTLAEVIAGTSGNTYKVRAVVLGYIGNNTIAIQDDTAAINIYSFDIAADLAELVGHEIEAVGEKEVYSGAHQLTSVTYTDLGESTLPDAVDLNTFATWTAESLVSARSKRVDAADLKVTEASSDDYGNVELTLENIETEETLAFRWDSRADIGNTDFLEAVKVGDYVTFTGALLGWYNGPQLTLSDGSQISAGQGPELSDAEKQELDSDDVSIPTQITTAQTLDLSETGSRGSTIVWTYTDTDDENNTYIDLTTGAVTLPEEGTSVNVKVTATVSFTGLDDIVLDFVVRVGALTEVDISALYDEVNYPDETQVIVSGILTGGQSSFYFLQDGTAAVGLYPGSSPEALREMFAGFAYGVELQVVGKLVSFRGYLEINITSLEDVTVVSETPAVPAAVSIDAEEDFSIEGLADYQSELVSLTGLEITYLDVSSYGTYYFDFVNPAEGFALEGMFDNRGAGYDDALAYLEALEVGDIVDVTSAILKLDEDGTITLLFHSDGEIVDGTATYTETQYAASASALLSGIPEEDDEIIADITLPKTGLFDSTIVWTSSNTDVIATDGTVVRPAAGESDVTVTLGYTVTVGAVSATAVTIDVVVKAMPSEPVIDLFISEYIEGSSSNKAIEFYNPTDQTLDLTLYTVELYTNGNVPGVDTPTNTYTFTGTLAPGEVVVLYHSSAVTDIVNVGDASAGVANFNGDDAIRLLKNGVVIDVFGVPGVDPGSSWTVGTGSTADHTLVRKSTVTGPSVVWNAAEWDVYAKDTFTYLGSHTSDLPAE